MASHTQKVKCTGFVTAYKGYRFWHLASSTTSYFFISCHSPLCSQFSSQTVFFCCSSRIPDTLASGHLHFSCPLPGTPANICKDSPSPHSGIYSNIIFLGIPSLITPNKLVALMPLCPPILCHYSSCPLREYILYHSILLYSLLFFRAQISTRHYVSTPLFLLTYPN